MHTHVHYVCIKYCMYVCMYKVLYVHTVRTFSMCVHTHKMSNTNAKDKCTYVRTHTQTHVGGTPEEGVLLGTDDPEPLSGDLVVHGQFQQGRLHVFGLLYGGVKPDLELLLTKPDPHDVRPIKFVNFLSFMID